MTKKILSPKTTLYPVPVVLISAGFIEVNVMTCNRISSCSAEPPRLAISIRPSRYTHTLIKETGEFLVSLPAPNQGALTDYLGVVSGKDEDKLSTANLATSPARTVRTPLLDDFPVNIECIVDKEIDLDSHTLFIGLVHAVHVEEILLNNDLDIDVDMAEGLVYAKGTVREKPTYKFKVEDLRRSIKSEKPY